MNEKFPRQVVLVRHGQSYLNKAKVRSPVFFADEAARAPFIGIPDHKVDITPEGERQAMCTGQGLLAKGFKFDRAYHSGYTRTKRTLDYILQEQVPTECSILLREREAGFTYSLTKAEVENHFPWLEAYWKTHEPVFARPPGGESVADVITRVNIFLKQMHKDAAGERVIISLHGRVLAAIRFLYEGWSYEELEEFVRGNSHKNCGVTIYEYSDEAKKMALKEYNTCYWE